MATPRKATNVATYFTIEVLGRDGELRPYKDGKHFPGYQARAIADRIADASESLDVAILTEVA